MRTPWVVAIVVAGAEAAAEEYCYLDPSTGACVQAEPCDGVGCPDGFVCTGGGYSYGVCHPPDDVACCNLMYDPPACAPGERCVPHEGGYGACLPARSDEDAAMCEALLDADGGIACAAHDCDDDGVADEYDLCVCVADDQADRDVDGIGDACDPEPDSPAWAGADAGSPESIDAGGSSDAGPGTSDGGAPPSVLAAERGCGCGVGGRGERAGLLAAVLLVTATLLRRRAWA